jgi:hypothetical protein
MNTLDYPYGSKHFLRRSLTPQNIPHSYFLRRYLDFRLYSLGFSRTKNTLFAHIKVGASAQEYPCDCHLGQTNCEAKQWIQTSGATRDEQKK